MRIKTPANIKRIIAAVPEIMFAKYKPAITIATSILTTLSMAPMFFFICLIFDVSNLTPQRSINENGYTATFVTQKKIYAEFIFRPTKLLLRIVGGFT